MDSSTVKNNTESTYKAALELCLKQNEEVNSLKETVGEPRGNLEFFLERSGRSKTGSGGVGEGRRSQESYNARNGESMQLSRRQ